MAEAGTEGWRGRRRGVRARITLVAASVVAVALVLGALVFWLTLRMSLYDGLHASAAQDAAAIASQLEESGAGSLGEFDDERLVQILDESGAVVAASEDAPRTPVVSVDDDDPGVVRVDDEDFVTAIDDADGGLVVIAGRSTESTEATLATVAGLLAIAVPLLVALVALTSWLVVGRALAPVDRMRRQVDAVTATTLAERVDESAADDEIARLARTLNGMLGRLEAAQATQRRFISDASHELKSPLAALRQYAEVARDHPDRITREELGDVVLDEGGRLERLVQGMLVLARADEGALHLEAADVDLDDLLLDEARRVRGAGPLEVDTSGIAAARVRGDPGLLRQLVRNLVDNAVRHARIRLALAVGPGADGASVVLAVSDDGDGIPPAERDRVFERFVRLDDARAGHRRQWPRARDRARDCARTRRLGADRTGRARRCETSRVTAVAAVAPLRLGRSQALQAGFSGRGASFPRELPRGGHHEQADHLDQLGRGRRRARPRRNGHRVRHHRRVHFG